MCLHYAYFCLQKQDNLLLKLQYFCKISDGQVVLLPWKQNYKHFEFFLLVKFVNQTGVI